MKIALVSADQAWEDKPRNHEVVVSSVRIAADAGAEVVIFPELTLTGFSMNVDAIAEDPSDSESIRFYQDTARTHDLHLIAGVALRCGTRGLNTVVCADPNGGVIARYAKIHPFTFADEHRHYAPGDKAVMTEINGWSVGFTICYDLRFPDLYTALGATSDLVVNVANWPARRLRHWEVLLQARAIENQVFMVGVNRTGIDGNRLEYKESSMIFGPDGERVPPVAKLPENVQLFEIDRLACEEARAAFPVRQDRRPDLYRSFQ